jgi:hypothetical protein
MNTTLAAGAETEPARLSLEFAEPEVNPHAALRAALLAVERAEATASQQMLWPAWLDVARCWRRMGATEEAHGSLRNALRVARSARSSAALVDVLCEVAENTCDLADMHVGVSRERVRHWRDRARDEVFEASTWLLGAEPSAKAVETLLRLSDVLSRCGDHDDASVLQMRALAWMSRAAEG